MHVTSPLFLQMKQALKKSFYILLLFSICINLLMLTVPIYMLQLFDYVLSSFSIDTLIYLTVIAIGALVVFALLDISRSRIMVTISGWLDRSLSPHALNRSMDSLLSGQEYGSQSLRDIQSIRGFVASPGVFSLFDAPWVPIYLAVIFLLHPALGVLAIVGAVLLFSLAIANELLTRKASGAYSQANMRTEQQIQGGLKNAEVVQAMGMMPAILKQWQEHNEQALDHHQFSTTRSNVISSISKFTRFVLQLLMFAIGAYLVIGNHLTPGGMIAGAILLSRALAPVEQSILVWKQLQFCRQSYGRLNNFFSQSSLRNEGIDLPKPKGEFSLETVLYVIPNTRDVLINHISMKIPPGTTLALVGPSGAGKSTLARLMVGVLPATNGSIRLDNADVYTWNREAFGKHVGYLPQNVQLFSGTVKQNIARMGDVDDEAVVKAAQMAGVHEMILRLPKGYETFFHRDKFNLSLGQQQKIALARTCYGDPQVIVLDEPDSHLDTAGELALAKTLAQFKQAGKTVILITHRMALLSQQADAIAVLAEGQLKIIGPSKDVLAKLQQLNQAQKN